MNGKNKEINEKDGKINETELLRKKGWLLTHKQYIKRIVIITLLISFSVIISVSGLVIMSMTKNKDRVLTGFVIFMIGFVLLIFSGIIGFIQSTKLQLYYQYKHHPEEFVNKKKF